MTGDRTRNAVRRQGKPSAILLLIHFFLLLFAVLPGEALATNGLNLIGFGAESMGMGGADLAVARETSAMNTNPAGLAQIRGSRFDLMNAAVYLIDVSHEDLLGNNAKVSNRWVLMGSGGYAREFAGGRAVAGIGLFAQGGSGAVYKNMATPFGTRDELSALFRIAKATPTVAYRVSDSFFLGAGLQMVYSDIRQKVFPNTSFLDPVVPARSFFGTEVSDTSGVGTGFKIGAMYKVPKFSAGLAFTNRINLPLRGGETVVDMSAAGLGKVTYRDARIDGLSLPLELGVGIAFRPVDSLLVAADITWLDWSGSMKSTTLTASDPDNPAAPPSRSVTTPQNWRDQHVVALGVAWDASERWILRAGYNHGRNPIPPETLSPILAAFATDHLTAGAGYAFSGRWRTDLAVEYTMRGRVAYDNPQSPFGPGTAEKGESIGAYLMLSRSW